MRYLWLLRTSMQPHSHVSHLKTFLLRRKTQENPSHAITFCIYAELCKWAKKVERHGWPRLFSWNSCWFCVASGMSETLCWRYTRTTQTHCVIWKHQHDVPLRNAKMVAAIRWVHWRVVRDAYIKSQQNHLYFTKWLIRSAVRRHRWGIEHWKTCRRRRKNVSRNAVALRRVTMRWEKWQRIKRRNRVFHHNARANST